MNTVHQKHIFYPKKRISALFFIEKHFHSLVGIVLLLLLIPISSEATNVSQIEAHLKTIDFGQLKNDYHGPFKHPFRWKEKSVKKILDSIRYSRNLITWQKPRPLFIRPLAEILSKKIQRLFSIANSKQVIEFEVQVKNRTIQGETFLNKQGWHWKILRVSHLNESFQQTGIWDESWKLVPRKGQFYTAYKDVFGLKTKNERWIFISKKRLNQMTSKRIKEKSGETVFQKTGSTAPFRDAIFIKNLRQLKHEYQSGVLDKKKYFLKLKQVIQRSGWNEVALSKQMEAFKIIQKEHLLPKKLH